MQIICVYSFDNFERERVTICSSIIQSYPSQASFVANLMHALSDIENARITSFSVCYITETFYKVTVNLLFSSFWPNLSLNFIIYIENKIFPS